MNLRIFYREALLVMAVSTLAACGNSPSDSTAATSTATQPAPAATAPASALPANYLADAKPGGHCSLDVINGAIAVEGKPTEVKSSAPMLTGGWVVETSLHTPQAFTLVLKGEAAYGVDGHTDHSRPDVSKSLGSDTADQSGFDINADISKIPAGTYKVFVVLKDGSETEVCDFVREVKIGS